MKMLSLCVLAGIACLMLAGCGPSVEERKTMAAFNDMEELIQRGGYVKKLERFEKRPDKVFIVEAEIVDENDVPIGRLRSERVEGFLTVRPRIQWYETPGVSEEWRQPERRRGPGQGRGQRQGGGPREGGQRQWPQASPETTEAAE